MEWLIVPILAFIFLMSMGLLSFLSDRRKDALKLGQDEDLRQLVSRYEQLAEKTMDAQQRTAADVAEMRSRVASIEQILRSVD